MYNAECIEREIHMAKKKRAISSRIWLPIVLALIACIGTVIAALVSSDAIKELVTGFPHSSSRVQ
jgi:hypothetical protein